MVFDVDVVGGLNIKKQFGDEALAIFIQAPSINILEERLKSRSTEDEASLQKRLGKVIEEMKYADKFDHILINDHLETTLKLAQKLVSDFIN